MIKEWKYSEYTMQNKMNEKQIIQQFKNKIIIQNYKYLQMLPVQWRNKICKTLECHILELDNFKDSKLTNTNSSFKNLNQYVKRYIDNPFYQQGAGYGLDQLYLPTNYERVIGSFIWAGESIENRLKQSQNKDQYLQLTQLSFYKNLCLMLKTLNLNIPFLSEQKIQYKDLSEQNKKLYNIILRQNQEQCCKDMTNQQIELYEDYVMQQIEKEEENCISLSTWYEQYKISKHLEKNNNLQQMQEKFIDW